MYRWWKGVSKGYEEVSADGGYTGAKVISEEKQLMRLVMIRVQTLVEDPSSLPYCLGNAQVMHCFSYTAYFTPSRATAEPEANRKVDPALRELLMLSNFLSIRLCILRRQRLTQATNSIVMDTADAVSR